MSRWMKETTCPGLLRKAATLIALDWVFLRACDTALGAPWINPASANCTTGCQQTEGSLYLNPCETNRIQKLWHPNQVDSPHGSTVLLSDQFSSLSWSATYVRDGVWNFRGQTWNEVDYEMHYVKWRIKKLAHSCYIAAVKKVHLDAEWHLHFPVRLCYRCFPLPTSNYDYRFSTCTVVLYMSIVFLRPLESVSWALTSDPRVKLMKACCLGVSLGPPCDVVIWTRVFYLFLFLHALYLYLSFLTLG